MKNYFCLKLKRDPNYYYKTEDTDPHQRELKLQSSLVINQQYFNKIKITDASLDQHEDLLRKGSFEEYEFLLFWAEQQSQIEPHTLSFSEAKIIHSEWFFTDEEARKINAADEKEEGAIFTEIINNRRQLEEDKSSFVNYIGRGGFWYSGSETSDAPDDGYSTITPLALKRYLADNGEGNWPNWYEYILSPYCNSEGEFKHRWTIIMKAFFGFSQEGKRNFFSLEQRKRIFRNRQLEEIMIRTRWLIGNKKSDFWKIVWNLIDTVGILKDSLEEKPEKISETAEEREYIIKYWKNDNSDDGFRKDKQQVYQIFNELTGGLFDELIERPETFIQRNKITAIQTFLDDWTKKKKKKKNTLGCQK